MRDKSLGERRSRLIPLEIQVPWGTPEQRIPFTKYIQAFIERKEAQGWRFERVMRQYREPFANINTKRGIMAATYVIDCLFSRRIQAHTVYIPDAAIPRLLANPRLRRLITDIS